jgi:hypothetical protein
MACCIVCFLSLLLRLIRDNCRVVVERHCPVCVVVCCNCSVACRNSCVAFGAPAALPVATIRVVVMPRSALPLAPWDPNAHAPSRVLDLLPSGLSLDAGDVVVGQHLRCPFPVAGGPVAAALSDSHKVMTKPEYLHVPKGVNRS